MVKKIFLIGLTVLILGGYFMFFTEALQNNELNKLASIFTEEEHNTNTKEEKFLYALNNKNFAFFAENITPSQERKKFIESIQNFSPLMDSVNIQIPHSEFIFFAFKFDALELVALWLNLVLSYVAFARVTFALPPLRLTPKSKSMFNSLCSVFKPCCSLASCIFIEPISVFTSIVLLA